MATIVLDSGAPSLLPLASLCDDMLMPVISALAEAAGSSPARQHQLAAQCCEDVHAPQLGAASLDQTQTEAFGGCA